MSCPPPLAQPDWTTAGRALLDWLDQTDRELEANPFEDLVALRPVIEARAHAVRQLAEMLAHSTNASWPIERLDAVLARTTLLAARIRELRHAATRGLGRCGRDRVLADSLGASDPVPSCVNCIG